MRSNLVNEFYSLMLGFVLVTCRSRIFISLVTERFYSSEVFYELWPFGICLMNYWPCMMGPPLINIINMLAYIYNILCWRTYRNLARASQKHRKQISNYWPGGLEIEN